MKFSSPYVIALLAVATISNCTAIEQVFSSRHLRGIDNGPSDADTEERGPNVDIIISDAAKKVKKATWWKVKHAWWKHIQGKDTQQARWDLGMGNMGRAALHHKNAEELKAYRKMYGKGPLTYPQL
ncbi:hypothetical protein P3T76_002654 [Phytophthora citrophthora]|uniref:RxLR effector protein n=1 Tax=Phytophthora citrophthora TaxID=4793 RepID=A0AAD9LR93_9STRA|nr:hypothetical protein P3T76_002654 [Phytophthora citrophthora]